jgi:hypothetical protein
MDQPYAITLRERVTVEGEEREVEKRTKQKERACREGRHA